MTNRVLQNPLNNLKLPMSLNFAVVVSVNVEDVIVSSCIYDYGEGAGVPHMHWTAAVIGFGHASNYSLIEALCSITSIRDHARIMIGNYVECTQVDVV